MSRVLVVGPYPPRRCGIGAYAAALNERLRERGDEVTVIAPLDGEADVRVPFEGGRPFREAARLAPVFDRILIHFQPALYFKPRAPISKIRTSLALLRLCKDHASTEILVHEADTPIRWRPDYILLRQAFMAAPLLMFHTEREHEHLERAYGIEVSAKLVDHRDGISLKARPSRSEARKQLDLPAGERIFVAPGFIHPDKGLDRAIEAIRRTGVGRLFVVGSVKDATPRNLAYAKKLRDDAGENVTFVERFLDESELDAWTAAADAVILPYRRSWSSGALARAQSLGTPAIVSAVGGLPEQASDRDVVVRNDSELDEAILGGGEAE
ncbi:MAG: glycosyltransferase family 4 protein [Actinomycetota bacterium]